MPVHVSMQEKQPTDAKTGKPFRHIEEKCPVLLKSPVSDRRVSVPNTEALQERTVRCQNAVCWPKWEKEQKEQAAARAEREKTRAANAKAREAKAKEKGSGRAAEVAAKANKGRQRSKATA